MNTYFEHHDIHTNHIFDFETECFVRDPLEFNKKQTRKILSKILKKLAPSQETYVQTLRENPCALLQNYLITKKSPDFDFWFALKLRQYQMELKQIPVFLNYHLKSSFNNDNKAFSEFLKLIILQYKKVFFNKKVSKKVKEYYKLFFKSIENISVKTKERKLTTSYSTLLLKNVQKNPLYLKNNIVDFMDIWSTLKREKFIHQQTSFENFKAIFKEHPIDPKNRIKWTGTNKELQWFIKYLVYDSKKVVDLDKDIWVVTTKCFVRNNETEFTESQLRNASGKRLDRKKIVKSILHDL